MDAKQILINARSLIERPESWCKGKEIDLIDGWTVRCPAYAIYWYGGDKGVMDLVAPDLMSWNDMPERTHAEVLAAFDNAIAAAPHTRA